MRVKPIPNEGKEERQTEVAPNNTFPIDRMSKTKKAKKIKVHLTDFCDQPT